MNSKKISAEDASKIQTVPMGKKHPVRGMIEAMKVGEILRISRQDFKWKDRTPLFFIRQITKATNKKFEIEKEVGNTGWVVKRGD